ncbi:MAG: hypothetical protein K9G67_14985 [Bacteroidales bacterium]|nr:hypothetical protein [Bacteroidales bacterium]MCF8344422.1 hypothetical protein [Bacteroidales bacterium]MCF8351205.1 hypothetical protein [Bacteroidales bacterium]MCF8377658.1 hypothetical protein [Bacteroidales bacterium]MCF8402058.1 hypothetical protein [Bacteroidales bacterium]
MIGLARIAVKKTELLSVKKHTGGFHTCLADKREMTSCFVIITGLKYLNYFDSCIAQNDKAWEFVYRQE